MRSSLPYARKGQIIGLLGGSFDPAHEGHAHLSRQALKRFGLHRMWWLVSPANPLKKHAPAAIERRMQQAGKIISHPRVRITDIETQLGTKYTAQTLRALQKHYHGVRFVWVMGADNLVQFHLWQDWRWIMQNVPVGVLARPQDRLLARTAPAARLYRKYRLSEQRAQALARSQAPAWSLINMPMSRQSSTAIRAAGDW